MAASPLLPRAGADGSSCFFLVAGEPLHPPTPPPRPTQLRRPRRGQTRPAGRPRTASRTARPGRWGHACPSPTVRSNQAPPPSRVCYLEASAGRRTLANMVAPEFVLGLVLPLILQAHKSAGEAARVGPTLPVSLLRLRRPTCSQDPGRDSYPGLGCRLCRAGAPALPLPPCPQPLESRALDRGRGSFN